MDAISPTEAVDAMRDDYIEHDPAADFEHAEQIFQQDNLNFREQIADPKLAHWVNQLHPKYYNFATLFPTAKKRKARKNAKRRVILAKQVEKVFPKLLYPGEHVRFITRGTLNSFVEQYFLGLVALLINRTVFVVTDFRVLLINCDGKGRPHQMKWQIPFEELIVFKPGGMIGSTVFQARDDKKLKFSGVHRDDRKAIESVISERIETAKRAEIAFPHHRGRDPLCPICATPVMMKSNSCQECGDEFVKPIKVAMLSLLLPCLGEFYLAHRGIGLLELFGYAITLMVVMAISTSGEPNAWIVGVILLAFAHIFDAFLTNHVASKGIRSKSLAWKKP